MDIRKIESVEVCTSWVVAIHTVTLSTDPFNAD